LYCATSPSVSSDQRLKTDITSLSEIDGIDLIRRLNPVKYRLKENKKIFKWDSEGNLIPTEDPIAFETDSTPGVRPHTGFIAQEVKQVLNDLQIDDWAGWALDDPSDSSSLQALRYGEFISPLVAAVQNIDARLGALEGGTP
jgi:hypothetical protein